MSGATTQSSPTLLTRRDTLLCIGGAAVLFAGRMTSAYTTSSVTDPEFLSRASKRVSQIPSLIGDWDSTDGVIDERERSVAGIHGWIRRDYRNRKTGYSVNLTVLCGPAGPMCVHPPTACFEGVGYSLSSGPSVVTVSGKDGAEVALNRAAFTAPAKSDEDLIRVHWGWSTDGRWDAPANPRLVYRGHAALYKIYVVDRMNSRGPDLAQAEAFLHDALAVIQNALRETPSGAQRKSPPDAQRKSPPGAGT